METIILGMSWGQLILWLVIIIAVVTTLVIGLRHLSNKKRKKAEQAAAEEKEAEDSKKGYRLDFSASTSKIKRLVSCKNEKIIILIEEKEKNEFIFSLSRPLFESSPTLMLNIKTKINGVMEANKLNNYQLLIKASPAAESNKIYQKISRLLFKELEKRYAWIDQKVAIKLHLLSDSELLITIPGFNISHSSAHSDLLFMLNNIDSEAEAYADRDEIRLHAKHFSEKDLEEVKDILREHFVGGVEFIYDETEQK